MRAGLADEQTLHAKTILPGESTIAPRTVTSPIPLETSPPPVKRKRHEQEDETPKERSSYL